MFTEESFRAVRDRLDAERAAGRLQLLPRAMAGRSAGEHRGGRVRRASRGCTCTRRAPISASCWPVRGCATLTSDPRGPGSRDGVRPVARASPARMLGARRRRRAGHRRLAVPLPAGPAPAEPLHRGARADPGRLDRRRDARCCAGRRGRVVVAVLPARRRLHAARDEVDHPVRAAVGLDMGRRVAGDRLGAGDGAGRQLHRLATRDPPAVARRRGAARAPGAQLPDPGRRASDSRAARSSRSSTPC